MENLPGPTAMGLIDPFFFLTGITGTLTKKGAKDLGTCPLASLVRTCARASVAVWFSKSLESRMLKRRDLPHPVCLGKVIISVYICYDYAKREDDKKKAKEQVFNWVEPLGDAMKNYDMNPCRRDCRLVI